MRSRGCQPLGMSAIRMTKDQHSQAPQRGSNGRPMFVLLSATQVVLGCHIIGWSSAWPSGGMSCAGQYAMEPTTATVWSRTVNGSAQKMA